MNGYYPVLIQILKRHGFSFLRPGKGDHEIWTDGKKTVVVDRGCKRRWTANGTLKDAGINEKV